jgi:hypothetical protein
MTDGVVDLYLNEAGLALMLKELSKLSESNDHFHMFAPEWGPPEEPLSLRPYRPDTATAGHLKVLFRPDHWDRKHFPHLFDQSEDIKNA